MDVLKHASAAVLNVPGNFNRHMDVLKHANIRGNTAGNRSLTATWMY